MVKRAVLAAVCLTMAGVASAGGGKIQWQDLKNVKEFDRLLAECKQFGQAMVVYFSSDS